MTKPSTTHVIEIQTGIGEPAFIPLSVGQELQPISLGKKGMWKIESARVLDVHAFMYFDGAALFLQSADPSAAAAVDGQPVGKSWTELHAPCVIDIGSARLRFYNLAEEAAERAARQEAERIEAERREAERLEAERREAERRELERREAERREAERRELDRREAARREAERREAERREFERRDYERRARAQTGPPLEGYPIDGYGGLAPRHGTTRHEGGRHNVMTGPPPPVSSGGHYEAEFGGLAPDGTADLPLDPLLAHGGRPRMSYGPSAGPVPGIHPMHPGTSPMGPGSGNYNPHATGSHPTSSRYNSVPPGYGSMTGGHVGGPPPGGLGVLFGRYKELSTPKRVLIVLAPFCLAAAGYLVLFDTPPQTAQTADAGEATWTSAPGVGQPVQVPPVQATPPVQAPPQPQPPQAPPQPQPAPPGQALVCPPGLVPYPQGAQPGGLVPCVPGGGATAPSPVPPAPAPPPPAPQQQPMPPDPSAAAAAAALASRTLERQAVDFVAMNDYAHAAAVYELLQQQNPSNRVYAEAARILKAKADGGVP